MNKDTTISIKEKVTFNFAHIENAKNVAMSLALSGYYVKLRQDGTTYMLEIYTDRINKK